MSTLEKNIRNALRKLAFKISEEINKGIQQGRFKPIFVNREEWKVREFKCDMGN